MAVYSRFSFLPTRTKRGLAGRKLFRNLAPDHTRWDAANSGLSNEARNCSMGGLGVSYPDSIGSRSKPWGERMKIMPTLGGVVGIGRLVLAAALCALVSQSSAYGGEIRVLSTIAVKSVMEDLIPRFERENVHRVVIQY